MIYKMIQAKRDAWFASSSCTINDLISYIERKGEMRDAQIDAIKTYLFLKIACDNRPLHELFSAGVFNSIDLSEEELKSSVKDYLQAHPAAAALFEYTTLQDEKGAQIAPKVNAQIRSNPEVIDYEDVFKKFFYDIGYTDYLFSLPMGAGKTYLMAAFIYLDLYFAKNEPTNGAFAHNFIIFAPSGLKTSVVPSLRTIQNFDPSWIIPEPAASNLKRELIFEVLDENKSKKKSNKTKNPNVQKIAIHQPLNELFGLVAVTNAEKVILDRIQEKNGQIDLFEDSDDDKDKQANELRNLIGKLPGLSVFIDEVHHAATDDKKLRAVVSAWMRNHTVNSVIGFSGTPYLQKAERQKIADKLILANSEISNVVYYYPLLNGIGNFLKCPVVKISTSNERLSIAEEGVRGFFDLYRDTIYPNGTVAKLGIYCGSTIETLEEQVFPLVQRIVAEYGLNPAESVLKFHGGNKQYSIPAESALQFASLDQPFSKIRVVLLAQIGKEGWDCKSLTGIILPQEGDCPTTMVLQTSCRCLRQVKKGAPETAIIYMNEGNADKLNLQLEQQHHISIADFSTGPTSESVILKRYNRMNHLKLPKVEFYQLKVNYSTLVIEDGRDTADEITKATNTTKKQEIIKEAVIGKSLEVSDIITEQVERGTRLANFRQWLYEIAKGSFGFIAMADFEPYKQVLLVVFEKITYLSGEERCFSSKYDIEELDGLIRKAFYEKRSFETIEELIPAEANLLKVDSFTGEVRTAQPESFYPDQGLVDRIIADDNGNLKANAKTEKDIQLLIADGHEDIAQMLRAKTVSHPMKDRSFHYLPYKTDSGFEITLLDELLKLDVVKSNGVEVYYNGDRNLTEFKIRCYRQKSKTWSYVGMYTPDFLIVRRKDGQIHQAVIVEAKGEIYANAPTFQEKRTFMEQTFVAQNNDKFGYQRFEYLYLEDTLSETERVMVTKDMIEGFFGEVN